MKSKLSKRIWRPIVSNSFKRALLLVMIAAVCIGAGTYKPSAKEAYEAIVSKLEVRETGGLMFARYNAENLKVLEAFLDQYESGLEHEKVLYLRAHTIWSLHQYEKAPDAYADYIKQYPEGRFARISRLREGAAYLFSGQADKALPRLQALEKDFPDRPEMYGRELAYAYSRTGKQEQALFFMKVVEVQMQSSGKQRLLPRLQSHFDIIRMVDKPLRIFKVKDQRTGEIISNDTLKGKVVFIDFWATWCAPCLAELPYLQRAHAQLGDNEFAIFSISLDEKKENYERMVKARNMDWHHFYDGKKWENQLAGVFDIHSIPANLLVDKEGIVRSVNLRGQAVLDEAKALLQQENK